MFEQLHLWELPLISALQEIRSPGLDIFFRILDLFDREYFALLVLPIIWLGYNWKWGARFFYILAISIFINHFLKEAFAQPRPFDLLPSLGVITREGYGFPSGASQNVVILLGMFAYMIKNRWFTLGAALLILLMGFSRVYLGVHFLSDVIGGWTIGAILLCIYCPLLKKIENWLSKQSIKKQAFLSITPLLLLVLNHSLIALSIVCAIIGVSFGLTIYWNSSKLHRQSKSMTQKIISSFIAICGIAIIFAITKGLVEATSSLALQAFLVILGYFLLGIWLSFGAGYLMQRSHLKDHR
jgi:membrane-associated phospholipid phosphatase